MKQQLIHIYDVHYKKLMVFSFLLLFACVASLGISYAQTGELFTQGVSLKGGITMTVQTDSQVDIHKLQNTLSTANPQSDISVRHISESGTTSALIIEASDITPEQLQTSLSSAGITLKTGQYSIESMGSSLGAQFYSQTIKALIVAFIAMSAVVYLTFRNILPSIFIIFSTLSDIISTIAVINILDIKIGTAGIAAFLMLIGYAVDNNILLTTRVLKRKGEGGTTFERLIASNKTGLLMTFTALAASMIGYFFTQSDVIAQIMLIITIGMLFDLVYTYFQNAGILRWYLERKTQ